MSAVLALLFVAIHASGDDEGLQVAADGEVVEVPLAPPPELFIINRVLRKCDARGYLVPCTATYWVVRSPGVKKSGRDFYVALSEELEAKHLLAISANCDGKNLNVTLDSTYHR